MSRTTWLDRFTASKLRSAALVACAIAPVGAMLAASPAQATVAVTTFSGAGGDSPTDATPLSGGPLFSEILFNQSFPAYWEFGFEGGALDISAAYTGSVPPDEYLQLFDAGSSTAFFSDAFQPCVGGTGDVCANLDDTDLDAGNYVIGIGLIAADPGGNISFTPEVLPPLPPAPAPEPASLAIFGGALAGLGFLRRRRAKTA